ncbi:MAG TPA: hypothetical protein DD618_04360 [Acholeplasmatales bacterium]|nr:hypothetical protein [Acholeplasmatales bacterium]
MERKNLEESGNNLIMLWNREFGDIYPLSFRLIKEKFIDSPATVAEAAFSDYEGSRLIRTLVLKYYRGNDPKYQGSAFVSFIYVNPDDRNRGLGTELLKTAERICLRDHKTKLTIGGDPDCLFSGVFVSNNQKTHQFFLNRGYAHLYRCFNLRCDAKPILSVKNQICKRLETPEEKQVVLLMIKSNFSSRWFDDVKDAEPKEFVGLFENGKIIGFVRISHPDFRKLANSTNLYPRYRCLGGIGPLGIISEHRGRGLGEFMVRYAVGELFEMGCSDVIVDWTGLIDFYKKCGFEEISDEFVLYELQLQAGGMGI